MLTPKSDVVHCVYGMKFKFVAAKYTCILWFQQYCILLHLCTDDTVRTKEICSDSYHTPSYVKALYSFHRYLENDDLVTQSGRRCDRQFCHLRIEHEQPNSYNHNAIYLLKIKQVITLNGIAIWLTSPCM